MFYHLLRNFLKKYCIISKQELNKKETGIDNLKRKAEDQSHFEENEEEKLRKIQKLD